jgi:hypothetical protein
MVNPPLASTAIGVVPPQRAGMASGVNTTFRQIGIAAGIAGLGSIFTSAMERNLAAHAGAVGASAPHIVAMVRQGQAGQLLASLPPATRGPVAAAIRSSFAAGLNDILFVTGALALGGALCALLLIGSTATPSQHSVRDGRTEPQATSATGEPAVADGASPVRSV